MFADASPVEAHAPLAIERDTPNPKAGKALLRRLVFGELFDMINTCSAVGTLSPPSDYTLAIQCPGVD